MSQSDRRKPTARPRRAGRVLRIGLVGAGMISFHHLIAWSRLAHCARVVAVCDPDIERAKKRVAEFDIPSAYDGVEMLLDRQEVDAIDIASPRETHASVIVAAAARRVQVLCQKPLTPTFAEGEALSRRVAGKIRVMVHENWRFRPWYRTLGKWLLQGDLGEVHYASMTMFCSGLLPDATGRRPALERQAFMANEERLMIAEVLIHHLDLVRWLFGPLRLLAARTTHTMAEVRGETLAALFLQTAAGAPIVVGGTMAASGFPARTEDRLEVIGSKASALFADIELRLLGSQPRHEIYDFDRDYQASFDAAIAHFVECLASGAPFETDILDNLETLRLVDQAYLAAAVSGSEPNSRGPAR
jgi:predicted dehydrogenase